MFFSSAASTPGPGRSVSGTPGMSDRSRRQRMRVDWTGSGHVPVARPGAQGTERNGHLVAPPRPRTRAEQIETVVAQTARLEIGRAWPSWRSDRASSRRAPCRRAATRSDSPRLPHRLPASRTRAATLRRPVGTLGTSLEMIEKHYGDARVDAEQLDEMIGEFESPTGNLPGTLPDASDDPLPSKIKEPFVFYGVPTRAGDRGRTGDVQLGKLLSSCSPWTFGTRTSRRSPALGSTSACSHGSYIGNDSFRARPEEPH